jgi:prepilin-type processing-associated H-X9-DG protein
MQAKQGNIARVQKESSAFTLNELVVVAAVLAILAAIILPTLRGARMQAQGAICLGNMKNLMTASLQYAEDNSGRWFPNQPGEEDWVTGKMDWGSIIAAGGYTATNWQLLITAPGTPLALATGYYSVFTPYLKQASQYKCPADPSILFGQGPRVRSYAANQAVGTCWTAHVGANTYNNGPVTGQWLDNNSDDGQIYGFCYQKTSQMIHPSPAKLYIFIDEHPDSISDGTFAVEIATPGRGGRYIDCPGNLHDGGASFSFADGHAQLHHWMGSILGKAPFINGPLGASSGAEFSAAFPATSVNSATDVADFSWLTSHTSYPQNAANAAAFPIPLDP